MTCISKKYKGNGREGRELGEKVELGEGQGCEEETDLSKDVGDEGLIHARVAVNELKEVHPVAMALHDQLNEILVLENVLHLGQKDRGTDPRKTEVQTDPRKTEVQTDPRKTEVQTDPRKTEVKTDPRKTEADPRKTDVQTDFQRCANPDRG